MKLSEWNMKKLGFLTVVLGFFLVSVASAYEPGDVIWEYTSGGGGCDIAEDVLQTAGGSTTGEGTFIMVGVSGPVGEFKDLRIVKFRAQCFGGPWGISPLWERTYGVDDNNDHAFSIVAASDSAVVVAGRKGGDAWLLKIDSSSGDTIWTKTYGGYTSDEVFCVRQTSDGGYILVGHTASFTGSWDVYLIKTDSEGNMLWQNVWGGPVKPEYAYEVRQTPDKGYIIAATTHSFGAGECVAWLIKTDANGDTLWTKLYGENNWNRVKAVELTPDSGYIFVGWTGSSPSASNLWVIKTDANGDTLWTKIYGRTSYDYGCSVKQTWDGGYIICGICFGPNAHDMWLLKTNSSGDTLWTRTYGTGSTDWGYAVQQTFDGGYIAVGMYNDWLLGSQMWAVRVAGEQTPYVTVISPNGCEDLLISDTYDITWFAADNVGVDSISILYSIDAGMSWDTVTTSEPNDSFYEWIIPGTPSDSCLVKVRAYDSSLNIGEDQSDSFFSICFDTPPQITVLCPNGGEILVINDTCDITWFATDNVGVDSISILYSIDAGMSWDTVATGEPNDSLYEWIISGTLSDSCLVKVLAYDSSFNIGEDQSDSFFSISLVGIEENILSPKSFVLFQVSPNPFRSNTEITFSLGYGAKSVELNIYDVTGRLVKEFLLPTAYSLVPTVISWNGRDDLGRAVPAGVYFVRLATDDYKKTEKAILLK